MMGTLMGTASKLALRRASQCKSPLATATSAANDAITPNTRTPLAAPMNRWLPKKQRPPKISENRVALSHIGMPRKLVRMPDDRAM
jgi:hypothetical protein